MEFIVCNMTYEMLPLDHLILVNHQPKSRLQQFSLLQFGQFRESSCSFLHIHTARHTKAPRYSEEGDMSSKGLFTLMPGDGLYIIL